MYISTKPANYARLAYEQRSVKCTFTHMYRTYKHKGTQHAKAQAQNFQCRAQARRHTGTHARAHAHVHAHMLAMHTKYTYECVLLFRHVHAIFLCTCTHSRRYTFCEYTIIRVRTCEHGCLLFGGLPRKGRGHKKQGARDCSTESRALVPMS